MSKYVVQNRAMELIVEECEACFKSRLRKDLEASALLGANKVDRINDALECTSKEDHAILCRYCVFQERKSMNQILLQKLKELEELKK